MAVINSQILNLLSTKYIRTNSSLIITHLVNNLMQSVSIQQD